MMEGGMEGGIEKTVEYGLYIKIKDTQGVLLIPIEGAEYKVYRLSSIKMDWYWNSDSDNNIKEMIMKSI